MNGMKGNTVMRVFQKFFVFFLFLFCVSSLGAQNLDDISSLIQLDLNLKTLSTLSYEELMSLSSSRVILTGTVASRAVIDPNPESFLGQIELIDGEWEDTSAVFMYQCYVLFSGSEYVDRIPARRSRRTNPNEIQKNSSVLIIGRLLEPFVDDDGSVAPVVEGLYIRNID